MRMERIKKKQRQPNEMYSISLLSCDIWTWQNKANAMETTALFPISICICEHANTYGDFGYTRRESTFRMCKLNYWNFYHRQQHCVSVLKTKKKQLIETEKELNRTQNVRSTNYCEICVSSWLRVRWKASDAIACGYAMWTTNFAFWILLSFCFWSSDIYYYYVQCALCQRTYQREPFLSQSPFDIIGSHSTVLQIRSCF